jgi:LEA14-like dessication related protein
MKRLILLLPLLSCSLIQQRVSLANCKFSLKSASLKGVDFSGFNLGILLNVQNPNEIDAVLDRITGTIKLDGYKIADVSNSYKRTIKARGSADVPIDVRVEFSSLGSTVNAVRDIIQKRRAKVSFEGKGYVDYEVPIIGKRSFSYPINLSREFSL